MLASATSGAITPIRRSGIAPDGSVHWATNNTYADRREAPAAGRSSAKLGLLFGLYRSRFPCRRRPPLAKNTPRTP